MNALQIYLDGADEPVIAEWAPSTRISGFTTNPSLMRKAGVTDYAAYCRKLLTLLARHGGKPISFEVFADEPAAMREQALKIAAWEREVPGSRVYVKIPICNSKGQRLDALMRDLSHQGIKLNITALYLERDVKLATEAVRGGAASVISVFAGRYADAGHDPVPLIRASAKLCEASGPQCELLWASTREAYNFLQAHELGCRIITAPIDIIKRVLSFGRSAEDLTLDTVRTFLQDAQSARFSL